MKYLSLTLITVMAALVLAACGSISAPSLHNSTQLSDGRLATSRCAFAWIQNGKSFSCQRNLGKSWMKKSASGTLLYVSDIGAETIDIFSYPAGKLTGTITGLSEPNGLCSDSKGNVFVTEAGNAQIAEFAHGGTKPIATFAAGERMPIDCAIDPKSGNLAVTFYTYPGAYGSLSIFKNASGNGTNYSALYRTFNSTFDGSGDLFVNGFGTDGKAVLGELPAGGSQVEILPLSWNPGWIGGLQWDGKDLADGDELAPKFVSGRTLNSVYVVAIKKGAANLVETAPLDGGLVVAQFWLDGKTLIGPDAGAGTVDFFPYPKGGAAKKTITGFYEPVGATLSR